MSKAAKFFTVILTVALVSPLMPILPIMTNAASEKKQVETPDSLLSQTSTPPDSTITILPTNQGKLTVDARVNQIK